MKKTAGIRKMPAAGYGVPTRFWGEDGSEFAGFVYRFGFVAHADGIHTHKPRAEVIVEREKVARAP